MEIQQVILEKNVPCKMRDGVTLYADVYRPNVEGNSLFCLHVYPITRIYRFTHTVT